MSSFTLRINEVKSNFKRLVDFIFYPYAELDKALARNELYLITTPFIFIAFIFTSVLGGVIAGTVLALGSAAYLFFGAISDFIKTSPPETITNVNPLNVTNDIPINSRWKEILEYGRWTPSPHNMQTWLFRMEKDNTVTLMYDPERLLPGTNPIGSFVHVGFGILIETLEIAAAPLGLDVEATYLDTNLDPQKKGPQALASLKLVSRKEPENLNRQLIIDRQTSRLPYNGKKIPKEVLDELSAVAARYGHKLEFSQEEDEVKWVIHLNAETMFFDMSEAKARKEVGSWMRFSTADAKKRADGLAAYAMNTSGYLMWLFAHVNWAFRAPGVYGKVLKTYEDGMAGTPAVAWISGPFQTFQDWNKAGHMMARLWLTMTKHGIYLHPFGSVITNKKAHELMNDHFKNEDRKDDLWMLVRMGYGDKPPQAQRMPLAKMIIDGGGFFQTKATNETETETNELNLGI
ncbi:MAG: hypothetical protein WC627_07500 [Legionella sp.]|jgi:hypothetical protein